MGKEPSKRDMDQEKPAQKSTTARGGSQGSSEDAFAIKAHREFGGIERSIGVRSHVVLGYEDAP